MTQYTAFGDGSCGARHIAYAWLAIPSAQVDQARARVREIKLAHGAGENVRLHCREIFAEAARSRSSWAHLDEAQTFAMYDEIVSFVANGFDWHRSVCVARKSDFPPAIPGGPWHSADGEKNAELPDAREMIVSEKWLESQCGLGAAIHFTSSPGVTVEFVADGDRTKIDSHAGRRQASSLVGGFIHHDNGLRPRVAPTIRHTQKCELLELADFCAYAAQRYWHVKSEFGARAAQWRTWYAALNFLFARYAVGESGQFAIQVRGTKKTA